MTADLGLKIQILFTAQKDKRALEHKILITKSLLKMRSMLETFEDLF